MKRMDSEYDDSEDKDVQKIGERNKWVKDTIKWKLRDEGYDAWNELVQ